MAVTLATLYALHDHLEAALRALERRQLGPAKRATWKAHDLVERVVIREQARRKR